MPEFAPIEMARIDHGVLVFERGKDPVQRMCEFLASIYGVAPDEVVEFRWSARDRLIEGRVAPFAREVEISLTTRPVAEPVRVDPCLAPGVALATPTFTPRCTLPAGHEGPCNWSERMALRDRLRADAAGSERPQDAPTKYLP